MTTIRVEHRDRFTVIDRRPLNDERLSFRARGVLAWLLDKPDGWRVKAEAIAGSGTEGRDAIRAALRELEALGYMERKVSRGDGGRFVTEVVVRETPGGTEDGKPALVTRRRISRPLYEDCRSNTDSRKLSTGTNGRETRHYDVEPLTPEQIAEKYGCEA